MHGCRQCRSRGRYTPEYIVCLEDGKKLKMLKRHFQPAYNMTPEDYRRRWGLANGLPDGGTNLCATRTTLAKQIGLGRKRASIKSAEPVAVQAVTPRRVGGRRKAA